MLVGYDFGAAAITAFLSQVGALITLPAYATGTLAAAITAAAPIVAAVVGIGGAAPGTAYVANARAYLDSVYRAAENALSSLTSELTLPVNPISSAALVERFDSAWWASAQADTSALASAGVGTAGFHLALDQAAGATKAVQRLYPAAESAYAYVATFGIRAGE